MSQSDVRFTDAFYVHMPEGIIKFECTPEGLYRYTVSNIYKNEMQKNANYMIRTVAENHANYAQQQHDRAK